MAGKKYKLSEDYWEASGIYDIGQSKTQRAINSDVISKIGNTTMGTTATTLTGAIAEHEGDISSLNGAINDKANQSAIAIVSDNNTHPAIANGQFVYVKNHSTLTEGLYMATSAIAANAALTTSNTEAQSNGGFNDMIKTKTVSGTTGTAGQFNIGSSGGVMVLGIKCDPYICFTRLDNNIWWGFLKNFDLSSPGAVTFSATIYYIIK